MPDWIETMLGEVVTLQRGFDLPRQDRRDGRVPIVSSSGVSGTHDEARVAPPGVVTGRYGTLGEVYYVEEEFWPLNTTLYVRDFKGNDPRFVYYLLKDLDFSAYSDKSSVPGINRNHLHSMVVHVPRSIREQRAIAHILGTLDDKIDLNRRMNQTLEEIARALFKSWFIDFDPMLASGNGHQAMGMDRETLALFPKLFVDSENFNQLTPVGWKKVPLDQAVEINPVRLLRKGEVAPYLDMANVPTVGPRAMKWVDRPYGSGTRFQNGDVLLARITPCLENGKTAFVDFLDDGQVGWGSTEFIILHSRPPLPPVWAYCLARDARFREFAIRAMSGTSGRQRVPAEAIGRYSVAVPPQAVAQRFADIVSPLFIAIKRRDEESRILATFRDSLLPKLLSGELRIPDIERHPAVMLS